MTRRLAISAKLSLGLDFVTKTAAILAQRRKGKTYTASVLAEEFVATKVPFVALDPTGAWWGLRAAANGKGPGLPVVVIGGQHGDLPLERSAGKLVAELVIDQPGYYVIDFSLFESGAAEREFATDFAERIYRLKAQAGKDFPMHFLVDEANRFVPQRPLPGDQRMLGAFEALVLRGGLRGIGTTLISQRAAVVNKNVLEQIDVLIVLRVVGPNDRAAVDGYVSAVHGDDELRRELMGGLASLNLGEAWIWEPGGDPALFERVKIRRRRTFNSSATPKPGEKRVEPRVLADVEIEKIRTRMIDAVKRAEATDPAKLQARIRELEKHLRSRPAEVKTVVAEVAHVPPALVKAIEKAGPAVEAVFASMTKSLERLVGDLSSKSGEVNVLIAGLREAAVVKPEDVRTVRIPVPAPKAIRTVEAGSPGKWEPIPASNGDLAQGEKKLLAAVALHFPQTVGFGRARAIAGFSKKSSQPGTLLRSLREKGMLEGPNDALKLTSAGEAAVDVSVVPSDPDALLAYWRHRLSEGERKFLDYIVEGFPTSYTASEVATALGYSTTSSQPGAILRSLASFGLVEQIGNGYAAIRELVREYA
jgi:hypothetical protein